LNTFNKIEPAATGHVDETGWPSQARVQHAPTGAREVQERRREKIKWMTRG